MFSIQYEAVDGTLKMQTFDNKSRFKLVRHLMHFERPFINVYEQSTPITKAVRAELAQMPSNRLSRAAREFLLDRT